MQDRPYCELPLANASAIALVDCDDFERLSKWTWRLHTEGYAFRHAGRVSVYLHREVLSLVPGDGVQADHRNRDRLDNRRRNLRVVSNAQNCQNRPGKRGFRGVYFDVRREKWMARVKLDYQHRFLGRYDDELSAAHAAEAFRRAHLPFSEPDSALDGCGACVCSDCREPRPSRRAA